MEATHKYKIGYCGSKEYTGVGYIGNIFMLLNVLLNDNINTLYVENSNTYYNHDNLTSHYFEWFFHQHHSYGKAVAADQHFLDYYNNTYKPSDAVALECKKRFWKNFSFNDDFQKYLNDAMDKLSFNKKTLGVQIRTGDMPENLKCSLDEYYVKINNLLDSTNAEQIFVACDSPVTLEYLHQRFNNLVYLNDIYRVDSTDPFKRMDPKERHNHMYNLAKESLLDTMLLSKCEHFIKAKTSALSLVATLLAEPNILVY